MEAVKGLRRELAEQNAEQQRELAEQTAALAKLSAKVEHFERLAQNGRWLIVGLGMASMGFGAAVDKILEFVWPG